LNYKATVISILLIVVSLIAWGLQHSYLQQNRTVQKTKVNDSLAGKPAANPLLLRRYRAVFKKYDTIKTNCTMQGMINIVDQADTSGNMKNVDFLFCKAGDDFYYRLGTTETINAKGLYIFIDNKAQTMVVTAQKKVAYDQWPAAFADIGNVVKSEGYKIAGFVKDNIQTISLHNEHNINCKQFSISFDTLNLTITHMYARMTNVQDPLRTDNEKVVDIAITEWTNKADLDKAFVKGNILKSEDGRWKAVNKYKNYSLTTM